MQNSFPMREWHIKHMEKIVIKFVTGLSESATNWEKRQNKRYGRISNVCRQIGYDVKQGATNEQVLLFLQKIRNDSAFSSLRKNSGSIERLDEVEKQFTPKEKRYSWD
ncbi:MAG: hypothetical protein WCF23_12390 [Candidatus Nitrosopolaris sp.]